MRGQSRFRQLAFLGVLTLVLSGLSVVATATLAPTASASAFTGADFDPGNIISDENFFNGNAMGAAQVQSFIDSKVTCAPGAVCLANLRVDTFNIAATPMCAAYRGAAQESAATIIYKTGLACGISQAVILVTLQKEQSLVTARAPSVGALSAAMGAGCYDNGQPCIGQYAGFFNQVFNGAYLLKRYTQPAGTGSGTPYTSRFDLSYPVGQTSNILTHQGCGSIPVRVSNQATHSLYVYTPYTPNPSALANLYGTGDACGSYGNRNFWVYYYTWFGNPQTPLVPFGWLDSVTAVGSQVTTAGWAMDGHTSSPIRVLISVDGGAGASSPASIAYPTLGASFPGAGDNHGFSYTAAMSPGTHTVCVTAVNDVNGTSRGIGCKSITVASTNTPIGWLDRVSMVGTTATAAGWAIDPDTASPISVTMSVDGVVTGQPVAASNAYPTLGTSYPGFGDNHGFSVSSILTVGKHTVCVTALNNVPGIDRVVGCKAVVVLANNVPIGWLDQVYAVGNVATATGWAIDQDTASPITVEMTVDGTAGTAVVAGAAYAKLGTSFPGFGDNHGFSVASTLPPGTHDVCINAVNDGAGGNRIIGCRVVDVAASNVPIGWLDSVTVNYQQVTASGWTLDRDTASPISVRTSVDGVVSTTTYPADGTYVGLGTSFPGFGDNHRFSLVFTIPVGTHQVCITAVNDGVGGDRQIGCRTVTATSQPPIGWLDSVTARGRMVTASGWVIDPDTSSPISVKVLVDGVAGAATLAGNAYANLGTSYPGFGDNHGFAVTSQLTVGTHNVCVTALNDSVGSDRSIGCISVSVTGVNTPIGWVDSFTSSGSLVIAKGWTIDPDTAAPIQLQLAVDGGAPVDFTAGDAYPSLGTSFPGFGDNHGFAAQISIPSGSHSVCITAVNDAPGVNRVLGCSTFVAP
jgi:hypothetical protein